jgi:ubiquinone/menaquinone biosynthesis C-methylase UbiE
MEKERQAHWNKVYETKRPDEVSWTQKVPETSLDLIRSFNLDKKAKIIDVGGGDSRLTDYLITEGYENITVLDVSLKAIERAKLRLGENANKIKWIVCDIINFEPQTIYDVWHDRATFHFLTTDEEIKKYIKTVERCVKSFVIVATFSTSGPNKCSGLPVKQYNDKMLTAAFEESFQKIRCFTQDHLTPFNTLQNFLFCSFRRRIK